MNKLLEPNRRAFLAGAAAAGALGLTSTARGAGPDPAQATEGAQDNAIRPFRIEIPEAALADLQRRLAVTRWPDKETVEDQSQGVQLATMQKLVDYWQHGYDWRKVESRLNGLPQFMTRIDGLDIHFIHVRSKHANALPLIMTHGWPGSIIELLNVVDPLTDPTAHGGRAEDAFHLVLPSMPGYGFSQRPRDLGWNPDRIARAWAELMKRLGYTRYVAQGGDWGAPVSSAMARQNAAGLLGIHLNLPATLPPEIGKAIASGDPAPAGLSPEEKAAFDAIATFFAKGRGYAVILATRPQTVGYELTDSPVALAAFMLDHDAHSLGQIAQAFDGHPVGGLTRDAVLDDITLYWLTNTAASSGRLYWESQGSVLSAAGQKTQEISLPVAVTVFPGEIYRAPKSWTQRAYRNLIYFNEVDKGGHFAAWEQPELFSAELRTAFRTLR
ncbi:MAG: epoxide hydrolase [Hyphomicrobiales bacterium]|nr:epoxide hydrolase [Hyphomicrobiales bacterium]